MISEKLLLKFILIPLLFMGGMWSCKDADPEEIDISDWNSITVTASAYNSILTQTEGNPKITAWGDTLKPGIQSIAVSRDLIKKGLTYQTPVKIEGFEGIFIVNDKMHPRWRNKIDIYMGVDKEKALNWGRRKVQIFYPAEEGAVTTEN
ncbi:3D domain-containing protein [Salinimicrobium soli]|uniref:3D domain-containing protein n=1 Tax=Salinimicrobium soli TaxID=1254399 RepID=UPI003AAAE73C